MTAGSTKVAEMNETSMATNTTYSPNLVVGQIAGIGFFQQADAGVLAQAEIDLAVAGVDGDHAGGAALQQAIA